MVVAMPDALALAGDIRSALAAGGCRHPHSLVRALGKSPRHARAIAPLARLLPGSLAAGSALHVRGRRLRRIARGLLRLRDRSLEFRDPALQIGNRRSLRFNKRSLIAQ